MTHARQPELCPCGKPYRLPDVAITGGGSRTGYVKPGALSVSTAYRISDARQDTTRTVRFCSDCALVVLDMLEERGLPPLALEEPRPVEPGDYTSLEKRVASNWLHWEQR